MATRQRWCGLSFLSALTAWGAVAACDGIGAGPKPQTRTSFTLEARLARAATSVATFTVVVNVLYQRAAQGGSATTEVPLASSTVVVDGSSGAVLVPIEVDIGACLEDAARSPAGDGCPLILAIVLRQGAVTADSVQVGPINARVGVETTLPSLVQLREVAQLKLAWPGALPNALGDTLRAGRTLQLTASAVDVNGATLNPREITWSSSAPAIATVNAQTGVVTAVAPGDVVITANGGGRVAAFTGRVYAAAESLQVVGGDDQRTPSGGALPNSPSVRVIDLLGRPAENVTVVFSVSAGSGQLSSATQRTNAQGVATAGTWTVGSTPSVNTVTATVDGLSPATITSYVTVTPQFDQLAVGNFHACVIDADSRTRCWGGNNFGQLGDSTVVSPKARTEVSGNHSFIGIKSRGSHTCGWETGLVVRCWGRNGFNGALGAGGSESNVLVPTQLVHGPYVSISPARLTSCALTAAGVVMCWGRNQAGELGDGTTEIRSTPVPVSTSLSFATLEASWIHTCATTAAGAAYCWGRREGTVINDLTPLPVAGGHVFSRLFSGGTHRCGLLANGEAWCWGANGGGQLGNNSTVISVDPVKVAGGLYFAMLATGTVANSTTSHTCGITITGKAYCWGTNTSGELGNGTTTPSPIPLPVQSTEIFVAIGAGDRQTCAMTADRRVFCWGINTSGELGSGVAGGSSTVPVIVP